MENKPQKTNQIRAGELSTETQKCYGCDNQTEHYKRMRVQYERTKQKFCLECYKRLVRIKMGMM